MRVVVAAALAALGCVLASDTQTPPLELLSENGEVVRDWHGTLDLVAGEHEADVGGRTVWHVHTMRPDGSERETWTGRGAGAPSALCHHGFAHFHPSGRYLLMSVESDEDRQRPCGSGNSVPGVAAFANLWVVDLRSGAWTNLTRYAGWRQGQLYGALSPYFSPDGTQVVWSKLARPSTRQRDKFFGEWELHVATFNWEHSPRLEDDRLLLDGQLYESHGFSPDGRTLLFSSDRGLAFSGGLDLFELDLPSGDLRNLTNTPDAYDEHARYSPDGEVIVWGSGEGVDGDGAERTFWSELNVMRRDGTARQRLTASNRSEQPESCGGCGSWPTTWSPDGRHVLFAQQMFPAGRQPNRMWRLDVPSRPRRVRRRRPAGRRRAAPSQSATASAARYTPRRPA